MELITIIIIIACIIFISEYLQYTDYTGIFTTKKVINETDDSMKEECPFVAEGGGDNSEFNLT